MISTIPASLLKKTMDTSELPTPYCPISNIPVAVYQQIYQAIIDGEDPSDLNIKNLGSFPTFESAASALAASAVTTDTTPLFNGTINNIGFLMVQQIGTEGSAKVVYQYMFYENGIQIRKIVDNVPGEFIPVGGSDEALAARVDSLEFGLGELSKEVEGMVKHEDYKNKKIIVLSNAEQIVGQSNPDELEGKIEVNGKIPLIKLNERNVIDIGSPITLTNINIPDGVRPTVQEKSQSGPNAHKMAYLDDIQKLEPTIDSLAALVQILNDKVEKLSKTDIEVVDGTDASLNDTTKDYVVVGDIAQTSSITAKSVTIKNSSISDNARLSINAGDVEVKGLAISGDFPKAQGGNAVVKINESDYIVFRDMTFNSNDVYNGIEIGLNSSKLPKYVLFDNCKFEGTFTNNPIIVFGTADDAIINIQNCSFDKVSNILRLSNKANTKCVVNISNCSVNQLETNPEYTGAILCQDYTSKGEEVANNLFSPEKITINFKNFKVAGKELVMPTNVQDLFEGPDKMVYLYNDTEEVVPYEEGRFPKVNIF